MSNDGTIDCKLVELDFLATAPIRVVVSVDLTIRPDRLFDVFLDADSWPRWAFPITKVVWTSPFPLEVGSTRTVHMRGGLVGWEEFLLWEPPEQMAFRFNRTSSKGPAAFAEHYDVVDLGGLRTRLTWTMAADIPDTPARMLPVVRAGMATANRAMLWRLQRYVAGGLDRVPQVIGQDSQVAGGPSGNDATP